MTMSPAAKGLRKTLRELIPDFIERMNVIEPVIFALHCGAHLHVTCS
jgi:hypothetical protein